MSRHVETRTRALAPDTIGRWMMRTAPQGDLALSIAVYKQVNTLAALVSAAVHRFRLRQAHRRTVAILAALDDRALRDIGVKRAELETVVAGVLKSPCFALSPVPATGTGGALTA